MTEVNSALIAGMEKEQDVKEIVNIVNKNVRIVKNLKVAALRFFVLYLYASKLM